MSINKADLDNWITGHYGNDQYLDMEDGDMYQVFDKDGAYVTQYANRSEAETYWKQSVAADVVFDDAEDDSGVVFVLDNSGNEVGQIRSPKRVGGKTDAPGNTSGG